MHRRTDIDLAELGFTADMAGKEMDPELEKINPEQTDGAYIGPSRGHLFPRWARYIGMPRGYGYGASMGAWILDYLAGWAGEWGMVVHSNCAYRGPAFTGDVTYFNASVIDKKVDEAGPVHRAGRFQDGQSARHDDGDCEGGDSAAEEIARHRLDVAVLSRSRERDQLERNEILTGLTGFTGLPTE